MRRTYRTYSEKTRAIMFAGLAAAALITGASIGFALPAPVVEARYSFAVNVGHDSYVLDYDLTLSDCLERWQAFEGTPIGLECTAE